MRRCGLVLILFLAGLVVAPGAARANWFGAETVDGPAPIAQVGGVSLGRDGGGAVGYVKQEGANPAGYIARFIDGAWRPPERLPGDAVSEIAVAAGEKGRLVVTWISGGNVFGAVADGGPGAPLSGAVQLSTGAPASGLDLQIGVEGGAYAVWSQGGDVRAAYIEGKAWTGVPTPLDIDPTHIAGAGAGRPRVAVAADDTAVVTWGEQDAAGVSHVYYRRVFYATPSQYPQEASVPALGAEAGGNADSPQIDVEYDRSFAWVVYREDIVGRTRTLARRLRGSTFDDAFAIDNGVASTAPVLAMNPVGEGLTVTEGTDTSVLGSLFADKTFTPVTRLDGGGSTALPEPVAYFSDRGDAAVAYRRQGADGSSTTIGRLLPAGKPQPEVAISKPDAGPVVPGTLRMGGDRVGDAAVAMLQGAPGARFLTVAVEDIPPGRPVADGRVVNPRTRGIRWTAGLDYLGPQTFKVRVDGREIGTSATTRLRTNRLRNGRHRLQIVAIDRRGQQAPSRVFPLYVDTKRPHARASASRSGERLTVRIQAADPTGRGSGVRSYTVDWGDGHRTTSGHPTLRHHYRTSGRKKITVTVRDRARNETVKRLRA
jgi:PKD domain